ncbi:MAG: ZIP family metal transporter [Rhodoferax sp.]|nr:ZIP family metal transporter [Rhodoferax sp.]
MNTVLAIVAGTLLAGIGSVWLAALLSFGVLARYTQHMLSMAAGALLATALMHLLPEAFESAVEPHDLFLVLLLGLVFFFLLDKAELWHHGHEHRHEALSAAPLSADADEHTHSHHSGPHSHPNRHPAPAVNGGGTGGSWAVLAGDSVHCFGDGVLIASAFIADMRLGVLAALAVLAHEVPHHMGDLLVLRCGTSNKRAAILKVSLAGSVTALGGVLGYLLVERLQDYLPYFLVIASSSFIYVALADLIPQLQKHLSARQTAAQIAWLAIGMVLVALVGMLGH